MSKLYPRMLNSTKDIKLHFNFTSREFGPAGIKIRYHVDKFRKGKVLKFVCFFYPE